MSGEAISQRPSAISPTSSQRCSATYSSWARPNTSIPTTKVLRIMVLRSASITSWLEKGNHGDTTISMPINMPNQSSHVRCLLKKPKPDIADLLLKRGIRQRPRSGHYRLQTRPGRLGGVCHPKDVGTLQSVARPARKDLAQPPPRRASSRPSPVCIVGFMSLNDRANQPGNRHMAAVRDNKTQNRFELDV